MGGAKIITCRGCEMSDKYEDKNLIAYCGDCFAHRGAVAD